MVKAFVPTPLKNLSYIPLLYPQLGVQHKKNELYLDSVFSYFSEPFVTIVEKPEEADVIVVPHYYVFLKKKRRKYLDECRAIAQKAGKPLVLIAYGDSDEDITMPNTIVFRYSQYRRLQKKNEIIMPPIAPDIGSQIGFVAREKEDEIPTVGFCGWAAYKDTSAAIRAAIKNSLIFIWSVLRRDVRTRAGMKGIYFRKWALTVLSRSRFVDTDFIIRDSHSLNKNLISIDPEVARREFVDTIIENDFSLTMRGDGNAGTRLYEILSLGRIPLLIDTDCPLPLSDIIPYNDFMVTVPFTELNDAGNILREWYDAVTPEEFLQKQKIAREYYLKYLRLDSFFRYIFSSKEILFHYGKVQ